MPEPEAKADARFDAEAIGPTRRESTRIIEVPAEVPSDRAPELFELPLPAPAISGLAILGEEEVCGTGVVFSAWQSGGGRVRVIVSRWSLPLELRGEVTLQADRMRDLKHRALPKIGIVDTRAERAFMSVADPGGIPLTRVLARHGVPRYTWSAAVMLEIVNAVAELHRCGILLRDIRPSTIHVDPLTGLPSLASIGFFQPKGALLRKALREDSTSGLTAASMVAPELLDPESFGELGFETDFYSIGATLYTLLAGTPPFTGGTTATILRKVTREDPPPISRLNPDIPEALEALCVSCLKRQPRDRPASIETILQALASVAKPGPPGPISAARVIQIIGDYRIVSIRERRGATVVYEVQSKDTDRPLLLELSPVPQEDIELSLRRQRELIQRFEDHPNILRIHEVGLHDGRRFTITDKIEARPLEDLLSEGPLPVRRAAEITRDIAGALAFCHTYGVVHRGARPDLILIDDVQGRGLLTSVGRGPEVAEEGGGPTTLVARGLLFATLFYFAPEQIDDDLGPIDGQTDVYILGVTLYEMLTGRRPFSGLSPRSLLASIVAGEARSPERLNHQVDPDIAAICLKALRVEKQERYLTANDLKADLERWLEGRPVEASSRGLFGSIGAVGRRVTRQIGIHLRRGGSLVQGLFGKT